MLYVDIYMSDHPAVDKRIDEELYECLERTPDKTRLSQQNSPTSCTTSHIPAI